MSHDKCPDQLQWFPFCRFLKFWSVSMLHFCHLRLKYHCIIMKCEYKNQNFGKEKLKKINPCSLAYICLQFPLIFFSSICSCVEENNKQFIRKCILILIMHPTIGAISSASGYLAQLTYSCSLLTRAAGGSLTPAAGFATWFVTTFSCAGYIGHLKC